MRIRTLRSIVAVAAAAILVAGMAGCAESKREDSGGAKKDATLIFGAAGEPKVLDPSLASDGETFRVNRQIYDSLLIHKPGTTEITGALAEKWEVDSSGMKWKFTLRKNVKFHDGTPFNAEAVCFNYNRWFNSTGIAQNPDLTSYWQDIFGGFAKNESADLPPATYKGCTTNGDSEATIEVVKPTSKLPGGFTLPAMSIHSPKAIEQYQGTQLSGTSDNPTFSSYALEHPTGTGAFKFQAWDRANKTVTLVRNDDFWGEKPKIAKLVFKAIPNEAARRQELEAGQIHGYDFPSPTDWSALKQKFDLKIRPVFNVLYMGIGQDNPNLQDLKVRQALAHAINREQLVKSVLPEGAEVATQFMPPTLAGHNPDVTKYEFNTQKAKDLLAQAGKTGLTLKFYYPTGVTRPYMPDPKGIFDILKGDLEKAGFKIQTTALQWTPQYLAATRNGDADLWIVGWTGDFGEAHNFIGTFFQKYEKSWGFRNPALFDALAKVDAEPDQAKRTDQYKEINKMIMDFLPGVPISHSPPAIVFAKNVAGVVASPLTDEKFNTAEVK